MGKIDLDYSNAFLRSDHCSGSQRVNTLYNGFSLLALPLMLELLMCPNVTFHLSKNYLIPVFHF